MITVPRHDASRLGRFMLLLACAWLPMVVGLGKVREAGAMVELASAPNPYFIPSHALLLYVWTPLVLVSSFVAVMTPGVLLALDSRRLGVEVWIVHGFALTLPVVTVSAAAVQALLHVPVTGGVFVSVLACVSVVCGLWGGRRILSGTDAWDPIPPGAGRYLALAAGFTAILFVALLPKFMWESFTGDGAHALETARLAAHQLLPFWDSAAGGVASFPGMSTALFAFPASWFVRLFGDIEVSARVAYLLVLVAAHASILAVAAQGRSATLGRMVPLLVWLQLIVYTVVQGYSSTYDPYSADLSMPGLPDTLQVFTFLGFVHAYLSKRWGWTAGFLTLSILASPSGVMLVVLWLAAVAVCRGRAELGAVQRAALLLVAVVVGTAIVPVVLRALSLPTPGAEHGISGLIKRFMFLQFTDVRRVLWVVVPAGIFPFAAFLAWKHVDAAGRAILLVAAAYFLLFYVQAYVMLHHYVPAMLLPLAAVWRIDNPRWLRWQTPAAVLCSAVALFVSLPSNASPIVAARQIGWALEDRGGGYADMAPASFRRAELLEAVFPKDFEPEVPGETYGGSALAWEFHANHRHGGAAREINYILVGPNDEAPKGAKRHAVNEAGALYVNSEAQWRRDRALRPPTPAGSPLYWNPRGILFRGTPLHGGPWILDVPQWLASMGLDVNAVARKLDRQH